MVQNFHLGEREREILTSIVDQYISTGEPVGSRTLARLTSGGLSSATISRAQDPCRGGYTKRRGLRPGAAPRARSGAAGPRCLLPLHQRKFSRLDHGGFAVGTGAPNRGRTQRIRSPDAVRRTSLSSRR